MTSTRPNVLVNRRCEACTHTHNILTCEPSGTRNEHPHQTQNPRHKLREQYSRYKTAVEQSETDKNGVIVEGSFDFGFIDPPVAEVGKVLTATIKARQPSYRFVLLEVKLTSVKGKSSGVSSFSVRKTGGPLRDINHLPLTLDIGFKQPYVGRYQDRLELLFGDTQLKKNFIITRSLYAIVGNKSEHEALQPKTPYFLRSMSKRSPILKVVEGIKPPATFVVPYIGQLPKAYIPAHLEKTLSSKDSVAKLTVRVKSIFMPQVFNSKSYGQHFKYLLWIEEFRTEQDLQCYDMTSTLNKQREFYYLSIPGLAEKRPSVLVGDCILVQEQGGTAGRWFEGHVHIVRETEVALRFHGSFTVYAPGRQFHVRFKLNRISIRRQHHAMDAEFTEDRVLFPLVKHLPSGGPPSTSKSALQVYNKLISSNGPQLQAVASIVAQLPGSLPFVLFGPPGTGKTITVIECIRQLLAKNPRAKVLACAPSNSAADLIAFRLRGHLSTDELFRFYAPSRFSDQVLDGLRPYTFTQADGNFSVPPMDRLKNFKVIVSTCVSAAVFTGIGMARGHFTHIFVDEAGQATEPETFISIKMLADGKTNVILSGDPKQLGPVIRSRITRELGLEKSYLERLMDRDVYNIQTGHGRSVVKLVKNFRSHEAILQFPNERFYRGDLVPCGDPAIIDSFLRTQYLPSKNFPVVFHAVSGRDEREASSPSFFNIDEVLQVKHYVQKLKKDRKFINADKDIGIIAPYHAQCLKLKTALRDVASDVKIGSVEEFQGQERRVIIISTVRSSKDLVEFDLHHTLGFVANPRRFNVAVTRAQAMLIIVGDPQVLSLDPLWRGFLNYVYLNGGWTGPDITWDPRAQVDEAGRYDKQVRDSARFDMTEFTRRMEAVTLDVIDEYYY